MNYEDRLTLNPNPEAFQPPPPPRSTVAPPDTTCLVWRLVPERSGGPIGSLPRHTLSGHDGAVTCLALCLQLAGEPFVTSLFFREFFPLGFLQILV